MSWSRGPRGYHHGNLKEALIRAALQLIAEKGPAGFTFAEAARFAGVSPAAPYRHFRDRDDLLADVARRYRVAYSVKKGPPYEVMHTNAVFFFDRDGRARLVTLDSSRPAEMAADVKRLLADN